MNNPQTKWMVVSRADVRARKLADRHYSRKTIGAINFAPPGRALVLLTADAKAYWVTSFPFPEYVDRDFCKNAWHCTAFRNEGDELSSELIHQAVSITRWKYGDPPADGMITIINKRKVKWKKHFGYCYLKAGFEAIGHTKKGLLILQLLPDKCPPAIMPYNPQQKLVM